MEAIISQSKRNMWVTVNYVALVAILVLFYTAERTGLTTPLVVGGATALILIVISFVKVYAQTHLWRFVHTKAEKLDEREILMTYESLRRSYGFFTVICLAIFLSAELISRELGVGYEPPMMPIIAALIYLAHILPASVIAWREREI